MTARRRHRDARGRGERWNALSLDRQDRRDRRRAQGQPPRSPCASSPLVSVTKNRAGEAVDGSPERVTEVTDIWTFARDIGARDPNWKLVATESA